MKVVIEWDDQRVRSGVRVVEIIGLPKMCPKCGVGRANEATGICTACDNVADLSRRFKDA